MSVTRGPKRPPLAACGTRGGVPSAAGLQGGVFTSKDCRAVTRHNVGALNGLCFFDCSARSAACTCSCSHSSSVSDSAGSACACSACAAVSSPSPPSPGGDLRGTAVREMAVGKSEERQRRWGGRRRAGECAGGGRANGRAADGRIAGGGRRASSRTRAAASRG